MLHFLQYREKRWLALTLLLFCTTIAVSAESVKIGDLYYELNTTTRTATVTYETTTSSNYLSLPTNLTVPADVTFNGVTFSVTSIADKAFANCTSLESISIPSSVTTLGAATINTYNSNDGRYLPFYNCTSLKSVRFEDGDTPIKLGSNCYSYTSASNYEGKGLFFSCPLEEVYIGRNIEYKNYNTSNTFDSNVRRYGYSAFYNQQKLAHVIIGTTVTSIPQYLFYNCTNIEDVAFGQSLKSIPTHAFDGVSAKLRCINLPATVETIEERSFYNCNALTQLSLGANTKNVKPYAFYSCNLLKDVSLGDNLTEIGEYAFYNLGKDNPNANSIDLPLTLETIGEYAFAHSGLKSLIIPNAVTELGEGAFYDSRKLQVFTFGNSCAKLPVSVLSGCISLQSITIPSGVITIEDRAFANCTSLESISIPGSVTTLGAATTNTYNSNDGRYLPFYNCTSLKSVRFEDGDTPIKLGSNCYSYTSTSNFEGKGLFFSCPLEEVYIGRNIEYAWGHQSYTFAIYPRRYGYSAFYNQPKLVKVTIGETVTKIPDYLLYENEGVTVMALPHVETIGSHAYANCSKLTTLNLGDNLKRVENAAFQYCNNITKLTFPSTIEYIGDEAFSGCNSVTEVTLGSSLKEIGVNGFYNCGSFTALILPDGFTTMGEQAFMNCKKLTVAKLGNSLTAIPPRAFSKCPALSEIVCPSTVTSIGDQAFYNDSGLATITMNEGLKTIGNEVFWNNSGVMQFSIPGTVTSMGTNCFYGCTRATYLTFRDGDEVMTINNTGGRSSVIDAKTTDSSYRNRYYDYFMDCPLRVVTLGRNLKFSYRDKISIYDYNGKSYVQVYRATAPFYNHPTLRSVTVTDKVTFLWNHLFDNCKNLESVKVGKRLGYVHTYAFNQCDKLPKINFPASLVSIKDYAFNDCDVLASVTFQSSDANNLDIQQHAFDKCVAISELNFPGQTKYLGDYAFANIPGLLSTIFEDRTTSQPLDIANHTFENDTYLKTVRFPNHLATIGDYTYNECTALEELSFPGRLESIGNFTFRNCLYLGKISFEDSSSAVTLGNGCATTSGDVSSKPLFGNSNLNSLYMGRNINYTADSSHGYSPFYNQQWLTDVRFSQAGTVTYCKDYLLQGANICESLILPESLQTIGSKTFAQMTKLKGITIPNKVNSIGTYAFSADRGMKYAKLSTGCAWLKEGVFNYCDSIQSISIPPVVTKMDTKLFAHCSSLAEVTFEGSSDLIEMGYGASQTEYGLFRDCPLETLNLDRWLSYNTDKSARTPFYSIPTLKNLKLGENVKVVDKYMFSYCTGLEELYLPDNIESVGLWGFRGCSSLKSVRFSQKLSQVSDYGFSGCTSLDNVTFPASMTSIADNSFSDCTSLKKLDLGKSLMIIGPAAFKNDTALEGIEIPETLYGLGVEAFANCSSLPNVAIKSISSVGKQAFQGCTGLQWISLSDKTTSLGEDSFAGCTDIKYVKSYAEFPPEGLVNFVESVPANGTLFVPEYSLDYYQYSPTWETWLDIRPLNENVMVSEVVLDKTEISFKATETTQLTATVGADNATDKSILWRSSDEDIASVDANGLVTAKAVGNAIITAIAADGSGMKAECSVTVDPTLVETIAINGGVESLKKGRSLELSADVMPLTATNSVVEWTTSDATVAEVDKDGVVKAMTAGKVEIKATATDGSGVETSFALTVIPPTKGDSNDNDAVTITDAVNTANYAVGNEVENFCSEAADVNADGRVTLSDASGTVTILLDMPAMSAASKVRALAGSAVVDTDLLVVDNYSAKPGDTATVNINLDNTFDYVAMQADIVLPDGISMVSVKNGDRATNHTLITRKVDANTTRIVLFDLDNNAFSDIDASLLSMELKVDKTDGGDIVVRNILASDAQAHEYVLASVGGHNDVMTGVDGIGGDTVKVMVENSDIKVLNAAGHEIAVYATDGVLLSGFKAESEAESVNVVPGVYVVMVGNYVTKVVVK